MARLLKIHRWICYVMVVLLFIYSFTISNSNVYLEENQNNIEAPFEPGEKYNAIKYRALKGITKKNTNHQNEATLTSNITGVENNRIPEVHTLVITEPPATEPPAPEPPAPEPPAPEPPALEAPPPPPTTTIHPLLKPGDFEKLYNVTDFHFILDVPVCDETNPPQLITVVHCAVQAIEYRNVVRETWGSPIFGVRVLFMIGLSTNKTTQAELEKEHNENNDLVQGNFDDTYANLTYKHVMTLKWLTYKCPKVKYVFKADCDIFVHMINLLNFLPTLPKTGLIFGEILNYRYPIRDPESKYMVTYEEYSLNYYPPYVYGWGMIYSGDVVPRLYAEAQKEGDYFWLEDVHITGTMAKRAGIGHLDARPWIFKEDFVKTINDTIQYGWSDTIKYLIGPSNLSVEKIRELFSAPLQRLKDSPPPVREWKIPFYFYF